MDAKDRIVVALDLRDVGRAIETVEMLAPVVGAFKIGLEWMTATLATLLTSDKKDIFDWVDRLRNLWDLLDGKVMWDGKWSDIPNTMGGAACSLPMLKPVSFTMHASAGIEAMMAACADKGEAIALAVTVLTSFEENDGHLNFGYPTK